ncbi:expressed unknown protein [Seminavis robusta]|uniref:Uncharacterized protein n=1 Tax=Seminavis robusta TaxID=568900 RepID=A0A9N8F063_9STRA|nr:expressed unknown protein [Seminavis robusta]|eukprot:Sro2751_g336220.1 n/a (259) ;mRNA; f:8816-9592
MATETTTIPWQRCTNKSWADRQRQEEAETQEEEEEEPEVVYGASDDLGATPRQIKGAFAAGGIAGAVVGAAGIAGCFVGAPVAAVAIGAGAAIAAAKSEKEIGEVARGVGDLVADKSEFLLANQTVNRTVEGYSRRANSVNEKMQKCSVRASQTANDLNKSLTKGANGLNQSIHNTVQRCSLKANQIKERASQVKSRVANTIETRRRRRRGAGDDETVFHDCLDDDGGWEDFPEDFKDALEDTFEEEEEEIETETQDK